MSSYQKKKKKEFCSEHCLYQTFLPVYFKVFVILWQAKKISPEATATLKIILITLIVDIFY